MSKPSRDRKEAASTGSWDFKVGMNRLIHKGISNISLQAATPERFAKECIHKEGIDEPKIMNLDRKSYQHEESSQC